LGFQRDGDGAAACANFQDPAPKLDQLERHLHQAFGFRPGDQHAGIDVQLKAPKPSPAQNVLRRLACPQPGQGTIQAPLKFRIQFTLPQQRQLGQRTFKQSGQQIGHVRGSGFFPRQAAQDFGQGHALEFR